MPENATLRSRIAGLADDEHLISGVAIGPGDVTRGLSGDRKVWLAEELETAAASLEGVPVTALHSDTEVGEVVRAGFDPEQGILYEARLEDPTLAERVADGGLEVSIEARHVDGGTVDTDTGEAMAARDIRFTGLAILQRGAAPSASAEPGEAAALAPADIRSVLSGDAMLADVNGAEVDLSPPEAVVNAAQAALDAKDRLADDIGDCGTGRGEQRARQLVDGDLEPADFTSRENGTPIPAYLDSHSEDVSGIDSPPTEWSDEMWTDGCGPVQYALWGGTATGTGREWAEGVREDIEAAMDDAEAAGNDDPTGASSPGRDTHIGTMTDPDDPDPQERVTELKAELSDRDKRIDELEQQVAQLREEREEVARAYAAALVEHGETLFDEDDLVDRFDVAELRERVEALSDEDTAAALAPTIQSGGGEDTDGEESASLSQDDRDRIEEIETKLGHVGAALPDDRVEELREEAADLAGTDSYEAALEAI